MYIQDRDTLGKSIASSILYLYLVANCYAPAEGTLDMATLKDILKFCTGHEEVPPMGLDGGISIEFLPEGPVLPKCAGQKAALNESLHAGQKAALNV